MGVPSASLCEKDSIVFKGELRKHAHNVDAEVYECNNDPTRQNEEGSGSISLELSTERCRYDAEGPTDPVRFRNTTCEGDTAPMYNREQCNQASNTGSIVLGELDTDCGCFGKGIEEECLAWLGRHIGEND